MDITMNAHNYDEFLEQFPLGSFLQSRFWKRFLTAQGKKNWQLNVYDDEHHVVAHALIYTNKLPFGKSYLYCPKGPIFLPSLDDEQRKEALELILSQVRDITIATRRREEIFCRLEPNVALPSIPSIPVKLTPAIQPKATSYLNLHVPKDELLMTFKEKTRYNIRLSEKKGVKIHWAQDEAAIKRFYTLHEQTNRRQKLRSHDRSYFLKMLKADTDRNVVWVATAYFGDTPIAANLYIAQFPTMTYLHGGFNYEYRNYMAPYLLQWDAITRSIDAGFEYYDFWGVAPQDGSKDSFENITRFKDGFNGSYIESPGCYDYLYNSLWYQGYEYLRAIRRSLPF
jgi:lipid II:glycine glycyltransferase (peptidoglycan interpeptide bridge formation enzyme)